MGRRRLRPCRSDDCSLGSAREARSAPAGASDVGALDATQTAILLLGDVAWLRIRHGDKLCRDPCSRRSRGGFKSCCGCRARRDLRLRSRHSGPRSVGRNVGTPRHDEHLATIRGVCAAAERGHDSWQRCSRGVCRNLMAHQSSCIGSMAPASRWRGPWRVLACAIASVSALGVDVCSEASSGIWSPSRSECLQTGKHLRCPKQDSRSVSWPALRRRLRIPHIRPGQPCPRTTGRHANEISPFGSAYALGSGPAYPLFDVQPPYDPNGGSVRLVKPQFERWLYVKVLWIIAPNYTGPVLVRGRSLTSTARIRFNNQSPLSLELRIRAGKGSVEGWRQHPSATRVWRGGCYGYQIDGLSFSKIVVFAATRAP